MQSIVRTLLREKEEINSKDKNIEEDIANREELSLQKLRIDEKLKRFDRKQIDDKIKESLMKIEDINNAVSDLQNSLNLVYKRTKQVELELKEALVMPS